MEDTRARAENYGTTLVLQDRVPFDLTQFKQKIRTQDFQKTLYEIGPNKTVMEMTIGDDVHYLNDVEFWCHISRQVPGGGG